MKTIKLFVYALIICISCVGVAEAKGRTGSFKSGFSSQKRATASPTPTYYSAPPVNSATKKTAFGAFGATNPQREQKAAAVPQSQMSKDLNANAAQTNALKTVDARASANEKVSDTNSDSNWFKRGNQNSVAPKTNSVAGSGQVPQPAYYQPPPQYFSGHQSNGLWYGLAGFMIGHSLAQQHTNRVYVPQMNQNSEQDTNQFNNSTPADGFVAQQEQEAALVEKESFFIKVLRVLLWASLISGIIWVVRKVKSFRNRNINRSTHYSFKL
jgi:hypothetical protein